MTGAPLLCASRLRSAIILAVLAPTAMLGEGEIMMIVDGAY